MNRRQCFDVNATVLCLLIVLWLIEAVTIMTVTLTWSHRIDPNWKRYRGLLGHTVGDVGDVIIIITDYLTFGVWNYLMCIWNVLNTQKSVQVPGIQEELRSMGKPRNQSLVTIENQNDPNCATVRPTGFFSKVVLKFSLRVEPQPQRQSAICELLSSSSFNTQFEFETES